MYASHQVRGTQGWRVSYCFPLVTGIQLGHWRPGLSFLMKQEQDFILREFLTYKTILKSEARGLLSLSLFLFF